jgi:hypothetical protein
MILKAKSKNIFIGPFVVELHCKVRVCRDLHFFKENYGIN